MPQPQQPVSVDGSSEADGADHGAAGPRRPHQLADGPDQSKLPARLQGFSTSRISGHSVTARSSPSHPLSCVFLFSFYSHLGYVTSLRRRLISHWFVEIEPGTHREFS